MIILYRAILTGRGISFTLKDDKSSKINYDKDFDIVICID
jgi:hypothetical protein